MDKLFYTANEIFQKEFKTKMRGYDPTEVDEFLDGVIKDYETLNREILSLREENQRLNTKVNKLSKSQTAISRIQQDTAASTANKMQGSSTNFDILKRISNLEKAVFGSKLTEDKKTDSTSSVQGSRAEKNASTEKEDKPAK